MQLDTARFIQLDTVRYSGIQWICGKMVRIRKRERERQGDTKDTVRYRPDMCEIQAGNPKNTLQGRAT